MVKRMLIDATHPEETRVVVVSGTKLEEFDFETSTKKQLKGNIYLAKVIRIEPSLQAAFVDYGGNRHGFLAFSEIHPDYYQIPVADREALIAEQERRARQSEESENNGGRRWRRRPNDRNRRPSEPREDGGDAAQLASDETGGETALAEAEAHDVIDARSSDLDAMPSSPGPEETRLSTETAGEWTEAGDRSVDNQGSDYRHEEQRGHAADPGADQPEQNQDRDAETRHAEAKIDWPIVRDSQTDDHHESDQSKSADTADRHDDHRDAHEHDAAHDPALMVREEGAPETFDDAAPTLPVVGADEDGVRSGGDDNGLTGQGEAANVEPVATVETLGGEDLGEEERPRRSQSLRNYKIQEVIKRRQILLVQVVKEERGNKGAALTTYLSLAGRYCVLMPNAGRGGGISRKISNPADRKRMKEMLSELEVPSGMGVILRTAGLERSKAEIKRDYDYLVRLWDTIREVTLKSTAPALIYEEGNLIKRSIRDLYNKDIEDIAIEGEEGYRAAKDFMRQLMPSHAKKVQLYNDQTPLFHRYQVETQLDAMHSPVVQLRSGGYIVINPTEALVAIDVNSGRATKERNIEETALRTNAEAAEEIARQLRLRDLAGLIVIDFIDMEDSRHQQQVERRLKEAMRSDRARIQIGRISAFGLLELSRQRLRPSLLEISTEICPHCEGTGRVRSTESTVLHVLRGIEEEGIRRRAAEIRVAVPTAVALYLLNQKRAALGEIEQRYGLRVFVDGDESLIPPHYKLERIRVRPADQQAPVPLSMTSATYDLEDETEDGDESDEETTPASEGDGPERAERAESGGEDQGGESTNRRRRRRRRGRRPEDGAAAGDVPGMGDQPPVYGHDMVPEQLASRESDSAGQEEGAPDGDAPSIGGPAGEADEHGALDADGNRRRRRRGRRGGRRRRHGDRDGFPGNGADRAQGDYAQAEGHGAAPADQRQHRADGNGSDHGQAQGDTASEPRHAFDDGERSPEPVRHRDPAPAIAARPDAALSEPGPAAARASAAAAVTADQPPAPSSDMQKAPDEDAAPAGPPRRGWWQRLTNS